MLMVVLKIIAILAVIYCIISLSYTLYINTLKPAKKQQFSREMRNAHFSKIFIRLQKCRAKAISHPNKQYEIKVENYHGVLKNNSNAPLFNDCLTDGDVNQLKALFDKSPVTIRCAYSEVSKALIFYVRYPKPTTNS